MAGELHSFPITREPASGTPKVPRFWSEMQELDPAAAQNLLVLTKGILESANMLLEYIDHNREEAHIAGVEIIGVELSAILEGQKIEDVKEALEDAARTGEKPQISLEGFSKLRRAERLVSDAEINLSRFNGGQKPGVQRPALAAAKVSDQGCAHCHSSHASLGSSDSIPASTIILGVVGVGLVLTLVILAIKQ